MKAKENIAGLVLILFYFVGIIGLSINDLREIFILLTPANLLLTLGLIFWGEDRKGITLVIQIVLIFWFGYMYEMAGVWTGVIFGEYTYGETLGFKLFNVPLIIGVNWFILSYGSRGVVSRFFTNKWVVAIIAALLMTVIDVLIEPVAIELDMWSWEDTSVPFQNYLGWFFGALVIQLCLTSQKPYRKVLPFFVIGSQIAFFLVLNLML